MNSITKYIVLPVVMTALLMITMAPAMADPNENSNCEATNTCDIAPFVQSDSRFAAMAFASSMIDMDMSIGKIQIGLATARLDETNAAAASIGFSTGTVLIKYTHTMSDKSHGDGIAGVWVF